MNIEGLAKLLIALGLGIALLGVIFYFGGKVGIGRLPGDIYIKRGNFTFYFPVVTSILLSIVLTVILRLFRK
jgi:cobalamin biosynthesis protein CobD/CbiB